MKHDIVCKAAGGLLGLVICVGLGSAAEAQGITEAQAKPRAEASWQAYADCAAGYRANWKSRQSDPSRGPAMSKMILQQSEDYAEAAIRDYLRQTHGSKEEAAAAVHARMDANVERFVKMDKTGALDRFLEECPQPDETGKL